MSCSLGRLHHKIRQARQIVGLQGQGPIPFVSQQVLHELRAQAGKPRFDLSHARRLCPGELGPGPNEVPAREHQDPLLLS